MRFQAVLFDFDGTLVDSEALHYQSWMQVLAPLGVSYTEQAFCHEFSGIPTLEAANILKQRHQLAPSAASLCDDKNAHFVAVVSEVAPTLMPFAQTVVEQSAKQMPIALVTGSSRAEAIPALVSHDLLPLFDVVICKDDVEQPKPHPEPYLQALAQLGVAASQAVAIEDSHTGLQSAKSAGLCAVAIPNSHSQVQDLSIADQQFNNLAAFYQWLRN
ncbi:HAD family hydrolase [Pseudoalteromonas 'SMAR']|uniref:HAD family hydrolase n=1 Tax=Pseudoalteromonas 'SMAR' TaxID=3416908 RepID=UPI003AF2D68C